MWYLCYFLHRLLDYRLPEIEALAKLHGYSDGDKVGQGLQWKQAPDHHPDSPFYYVNLPNEGIARKVATQSKLASVFFLVIPVSSVSKKNNHSSVSPFVHLRVIFQLALRSYFDSRTRV